MTYQPGPQERDVLISAASLRTGSLNKQLARLAAEVAEQKDATVDLASMDEFDVAM